MGRSRAAWEQTEHGWTLVDGSTLAGRSSRMLALAARAAADLAVGGTDVDAERLAMQLRERAAGAQSFAAHPARVMASAYGCTFDAELARLRRSGEESAWRADKQIWARYDVPHRAAYAGWRLAEHLVATGRRKAAETELVEAHLAAESHIPLRREIAGLARRARLRLPAAQAAPAHGSDDWGDPGVHAWPHPARARRPAAARLRSHECRHRPAALHEPEDGQRPRQCHPPQARRERPGPGRDDRRTDGAPGRGRRDGPGPGSSWLRAARPAGGATLRRRRGSHDGEADDPDGRRRPAVLAGDHPRPARRSTAPTTRSCRPTSGAEALDGARRAGAARTARSR